ncbi:DUF695 domain-containing protein [Roseivirga sp. UBA1976]|uniref:DUF695 domain-containing protein n=1 Tax=Roseivirga sp. UBA1976 TaxID=1947386 RepID=UPI00257B4C72|nr:DUF695 domain-containing protein [Roseivirga sp. UBA1976]|tara:strand:+ start:3977 stop:4435 length:459 start_codon:yes stop_codon:yes gene_type:complete
MKEFKVLIPEEDYSILNFRQEDLPGVAVVNISLRDFEPKEVFAWHLSIMVELNDLGENGMPTKSEVDVIDNYGDFLDDRIKGEDKDKPNALFLARITWNGTRELISRVYDPEIANDFLQELIEEGNQVREFDYRMENDEEWKLAEWHLTKRD